MDKRFSNELSIEISIPHRALIDELTATVMAGKRAEILLKQLVQGILQQGGARDGIQYSRSDDGLKLVPSQITLTAEQLQNMAMQQAQEN
jgi:hypothetical protein